MRRGDRKLRTPQPEEREGLYSGKLSLPLEALAAGLGDQRIVTTQCPGGKERMRRLMELVPNGKVDLTPLLTHRCRLERIVDAYRLFAERHDGVIKVAIRTASESPDDLG